MNGTRRSSLFRALPLGVAFCLLSGAVFAIDIEVYYGAGFDDPALGNDRRAAFEAAVQTWESVLSGNVTVRVDVEFKSLDGGPNSAVLGAAGPLTAHRDFNGAPRSDTWYIGALADQLKGNDLDPGMPDIQAEFNIDLDGDYVLGTTHWYYGTDGNPPGNDVDFLSVVLHELGHGLGFLTLMDQNGYWFSAAGSASPDAFAVHLTQPGSGDLVDMTASQRKSAQVSDNLWWKGPSVVAEHGGQVKMYAPSPFESGSSTSHWDTSNSPDLLMEPYDTGPKQDVDLTQQAFEDMGWSTSFEPSLVLSDTTVDLGASLDSDTFEVWNGGGGPMDYTLSVLSGSSYFDVTPKSGSSLSPSERGTHTVTVQRSLILLGQSAQGTIQVSSAEADNAPIPIQLKARRALSAPTGLDASDGVYTDGVSLAWTGAPGATHYRVYRDLSEAATPSALSGWLTNTVYDDLSAAPGVLYYYWVTSAIDASATGESDLSAYNTGWVYGDPLAAPSYLDASDDAYIDYVRIECALVGGASHYRFYRSIGKNGTREALSEWQTGRTLFDTTGQPGVEYVYWAQAAISAAGDRAGLFASDAGRRPAQSELKDFKITYKRSALSVQDGTRLVVSYTDSKSTLKIKTLKKPPSDPNGKPGTAYARGILFPEVTVDGPLKKLWTDTTILRLDIDGSVKSLVAKNSWVGRIDAGSVGSAKMTALENAEGSPATYAAVEIHSQGGSDGMKVRLAGVILERLSTSQWIKSLKVSSKKHKLDGATAVSLGGVGRISDEALADPGDDYWIIASEIRTISAKGCSIRPDVIAAFLEIGKISAKPKTLNGTAYGGSLGVLGAAEQLSVYGANIDSIYGGSGVSGEFVAGFDLGLFPTYTGAIGRIGTAKNGGILWGAAYLSPMAKPIKFKPEQGQFFEVYTGYP